MQIDIAEGTVVSMRDSESSRILTPFDQKRSGKDVCRLIRVPIGESHEHGANSGDSEALPEHQDILFHQQIS